MKNTTPLTKLTKFSIHSNKNSTPHIIHPLFQHQEPTQLTSPVKRYSIVRRVIATMFNIKSKPNISTNGAIIRLPGFVHLLEVEGELSSLSEEDGDFFFA